MVLAPAGRGRQTSAKRGPPSQQDGPSAKRRRVHPQTSRVIAVQTSGKAFGNGQVDVDNFVRAREFEIRALEDSMRRSRNSLSTRAFQNVPRYLRRRTASHNPKKLPKRLRSRAKKEMIDDNTPPKRSKLNRRMRLRVQRANQHKFLANKTRARKLGKRAELQLQQADHSLRTNMPPLKDGSLQKPLMPKARFRKRQLHKTWLPTHLFHAKRAHMTPPKESLWRMAIPLSPNEKCYRPTHRAAHTRGAIAWDMSYVSTIGLEGPEQSLDAIFKALGVDLAADGCVQDLHKALWKSGARTWSGMLYERRGQPTECIAPATIIRCPPTSTHHAGADARLTTGKRPKEKAFLRVHPSAFMKLWDQVIELSKIQKSSVVVQDLRFEIGSIEVAGPASTEALVGAIHPMNCQEDVSGARQSPGTIWPTLAGITSAANLPRGSLIAFDATDPRLCPPPRSSASVTSDEAYRQMLQILARWPLDRVQEPSNLFSRRERVLAQRRLPSQKSINRRKSLSTPSCYPEPHSTDPRIPVMVLANNHGNKGHNSWTILLPWKCVLPLWYCLVQYPLASGGTLRFGGLDQTRQLHYEANEPWFPGDFPGTEAGMAWEMRERGTRRKAWESRPKGKRIQWESVDLDSRKSGELGCGWACDWTRLTSLPDADDTMEGKAVLPIRQLTLSQALNSLNPLKTLNSSDSDLHVLTAIKISFLTRGVPTTCARIYRLPSDNDLRKNWLSLQPASTPSTAKTTKNGTRPTYKSIKEAEPHLQQQRLAAILLDGNSQAKANEEPYPAVPGEKDLIGFVTTGNFNLGEGRGTAIGNISVGKLAGTKPLAGADARQHSVSSERHLCIVRESGQSIGRLARWELA